MFECLLAGFAASSVVGYQSQSQAVFVCPSPLSTNPRDLTHEDDEAMGGRMLNAVATSKRCCSVAELGEKLKCKFNVRMNLDRFCAYGGR